MSVTGQCLCHAIRYEITAFAASPVHCHCQTCRRRQGVAMSTNVPVANDDFRLLQGDTALSSFESSPGKRGYFCRHCGSHLYAKKDGLDYYIVRMGCLDDVQGDESLPEPLPEPCAHIWRSDAAPWFDPASSLKELPEGRQQKS